MLQENYILFVESNTTGTGIQTLRKAHELGFKPILFTRDPTLYPELETMSCVLIQCETNNSSILYKAATNHLQNKSGKLCGVITTSEFYTEIAADLANELKLPTNSPETINICRNKGRTRQVLTDLGFLQPRFVKIYESHEIEDALAQIGLPCIIKPCDNTASYGVKLCNSIADVRVHSTNLLDQRTNVRGQKTAGFILCEQYINGNEFSVETFGWQGEITCIGITQKKVSGFPYFVEKSHILPAPLAAESKNIIETTVINALRVCGNTYGAAHTEVKLTPQGCVIIEINARMAGDLIPELIWQARGIDMLESQIKAACGQKPSLEPCRSACAAIYFFTASTSGTLEMIHNLDALCNHQDTVQVIIKTQVGGNVNVPQYSHDRLGHVIIRANNYSDLSERLAQIEKDVVVEVKVLGHKG